MQVAIIFQSFNTEVQPANNQQPEEIKESAAIEEPSDQFDITNMELPAVDEEVTCKSLTFTFY